MADGEAEEPLAVESEVGGAGIHSMGTRGGEPEETGRGCQHGADACEVAFGGGGWGADDGGGGAGDCTVAVTAFDYIGVSALKDSESFRFGSVPGPLQIAMFWI